MNKNLLFTLLCLLSAGFVHAQTSGWEMGWSVSGGGTFALNPRLQMECSVGQENDKVQLSPSWSYSAGVLGRKFFKKMYGIEIGVQYTSVALRSTQFAGYYFLTVTESNPTSYSQGYVEIPVRFVFKKDINKFSIGGFAGISPAVLVKAQVHNSHFPDQARHDFTKQSNSFNLIADAGLLLRGNICPNFSLEARPYFRVSARQSYRGYSNFFNTRFMTTGISLGGTWKF